MRLLDRLSHPINIIFRIGRFQVRPLSLLVFTSLMILVLVVLSGCSTIMPTASKTAPTSAAILPSSKPLIPASSLLPSGTSAAATTGKSTLKSLEAFPLKVKASLSSHGVSLSIEAMIRNPNSENVTIDDFKVSTLNASGSNCTQDTFPGGSIEAITSKVFTFNIEIPGQFLAERELTLEVSTQTATPAAPLPIKSDLQINVSDTLERLIIHPGLNLQTSISKISYFPGQPMVEAEVEGTITNPNPLDLNFTYLWFQIYNKNDVPTRDSPIQSASIPGAVIPASTGYPFKSTLYLPLAVLNQTGLKTYAYTSVQYLNYLQSINNTVAFSVPKVGSLLSIPQLTFNVKSGWKNNEVNKIYVVSVTGEVTNDNAFSLTGGDFKLNLYNNATGALLKSATTSIDIVKGSSTRSVINASFDFTQQDMGRKGFDLAVAGDINMGLQGVNEKIPVSARIVSPLVP